jgi:hypothetical protein
MSPVAWSRPRFDDLVGPAERRDWEREPVRLAPERFVSTMPKWRSGMLWLETRRLPARY